MTTTAVKTSLPLLHKYVLSPQDDMELTLTKLKFRLCVKEVSDVLQMRSKGRTDLSPDHGNDQTMNQDPYEGCDDDAYYDDTPSAGNRKIDDSGIGNDFSILEGSKDMQKFDEVPEDFDISRQTDLLNDDLYAQETYAASMSLSSPSSSPSSESDEDEPQANLCEMERSSEEVGEAEEKEFYENIHADDDIHPASPPLIAPYFIDQPPQSQQPSNDQPVAPHSSDDLSSADRLFVMEHEPTYEAPVYNEVTDIRNQKVAVVIGLDQRSDENSLNENGNATNRGGLSFPGNNSGSQDLLKRHIQNDDRTPCDKELIGTGCNDVAEALRILKTHPELPKITPRQTAVVTFSCWNVADLVRGPQAERFLGEQLIDRTLKPKSKLQVTNERIMNKERKIAEIYKKIKERDEEDQRMMEEFMKKQKIPVAEPLPVNTSTISSAVSSTYPVVEKSQTLPKLSLEPAEKAERSPKDDLPQKKSTLPPERTENKKKKRQGSVLQNVVHSLQRRFSKRGRETVA